MELNEIVQRHPVWAAAHTLPIAVPSRLWKTGLFGECRRGKLPWPKLGSQIGVVRAMVYHAFLACFSGMQVWFAENGSNRTRLYKSLYISLPCRCILRITLHNQLVSINHSIKLLRVKVDWKLNFDDLPAQISNKNYRSVSVISKTK